MSYKIDLVGVAGGFSPIYELPGFRGCAPWRRGSGQANKAERIGTACRGDSWSDLAWERGEGFPLLIQYFIYFCTKRAKSLNFLDNFAQIPLYFNV